ncbi:1-acyl-sn-glycerol-3-phosphate acyltransferase, putative [Plasmodium berghei]|uniref:1-acyl-sn-glycerol-3-phosphate acyltransferase, putative n=2 Tax=Plasmodium berghei TaxID=5821 RepID=A0A509ARG7_PLABA|nr:1-acyl-sn-glycerol-3-phosphate acyltransferase, putative [Plasmodium berghei ANKA]CXI89525.1 1-acyl-sn-glycerol-3-phosphate acyltransferase, putative [Plasmodium berghei]SCL96079.1 1-acyl-sn-glycerol-3-phosphate acyltransferase, putative [Plasmodium berghei]SCM16358.1 1-acyl-sn-glycerol-3-phosphate acyltransferase, putative [Plasmodium berghei]SCM18152.1 1-acyl-sn-glycerol-3-phosphate acyltransferase, putative [Plasmodium berghei]SCN27579.1 1-acyl-sn-glycerol-3-phosphate acyltransferase, pu|eukprot:XP_034423235.1 1-acyl-sn-glycerol-3-phosphate acyltransferase, putative [Plasmodium berghei ANKA]
METVNKNETKKPNSRMIRVFISGYIITLLILLITLSFVFDVIALLLFLPIVLYSRSFRLFIFGVPFKFFMGLAFSLLNPFWKIKIIKKLKKNYNPSNTILFSNHLSSLDPWSINAFWFMYNIKFICKGSLFKLPICGQLLTLAEEIPIHFGKGKGGWEVKKESKENAMKLAKEYTNMNIPIAVFPEGTRSRTGKLQMFKMGFFKFAIENNMEILPCALHGSNKLWPLNSLLLNKGTMYISYGEPFRPTQGMTVEELANKTRNIIFDLIKEFPDYDPNVDQLATEFSQTREQGI